MDDVALIDWTSDESHVMLNPRMPSDEAVHMRSLVANLPAHLWLATSGTTGALKLTALSKQAMLASAAAVNRHLRSDARDVWCCVLPTFHVGGLGILARAFLSGARVISAQWNPHEFSLNREMTLASLVPAQVNDLMELVLTAPSNLRAIVIGGGALPTGLYANARALGWPLLPSYGMTETCSQVATAALSSPELLLLDHMEARIEGDGRLALRSQSLLTGYATEDGFVDPKTAEGWFITEDLGSIEDLGARDGRIVHVDGRSGDFVKIGGESVDLTRLDAILAAIAGIDAAVVAVPDARLGHVIHLAIGPSGDADRVLAAFNSRVHPFEGARAIHRVGQIPRSPLGKLLRINLLDAIRSTME